MNQITDVLQLLNLGLESGKLSTGSRSFDEILNGGIDFGKITELYGEAGSGKSQLILQLAVTVTRKGSQAVILDTEGKLSTTRLLQIANSDKRCMDRILIRRCRNKEELLSSLQLLPTLIKNKPGIRAIFVDSIAQPFRYCPDKTDITKNPGFLYRIAAILNEIAFLNNIAVVITNQVTTKISGEERSLVPALGDAWRHAVATRIRLKYPNIQDKDEDYEPGSRIAIVEKCSACKVAEASFLIGECGIQDL